MPGVGVVRSARRRVDEGDGVHRGRPSSRSTPAVCTAGCGCGPGRGHDVRARCSRVLRERACPLGRVSRPGRQRPPALLLMIFTVCVLHCPPTGADMHRVVSSPDLASMARLSWGGSACHLPAEYKDRLTETPEMRLKKHLGALKAAAAEHGFDSWMHDKTLVAGTKPSHTSNAKPPMELPPTTAKGHCPRRRLFDDERFSTVTPEPSDSMSGAPYPRSSSASLRRLAPSGVDAFHATRRQTVFSTSANNEAAQDLEEYLHVERSIAVGKPASKTSVICFDFDRTLSKDHVHQMTQLSRTGLTTQEAVAAFGGHRRIQHLAAFLSELEACGAAIHIISLGHKSEISDSLSRVGLDHLFTPDRIIGCDELRNLRLVTKAQCIAYVASLYGLQRSDALLVDDDHEQLLECSESTETDLPPSCGSAHNLAAADGGTCGTYWVRSGRGLTERDMAAICGMARTRKQVAMANTH